MEELYNLFIKQVEEVSGVSKLNNEEWKDNPWVKWAAYAIAEDLYNRALDKTVWLYQFVEWNGLEN